MIGLLSRVRIEPCHALGECLLVIGPDNHTVSVNPLSSGDGWRTDCDTCGTCLSDRHSCRSAALAKAQAHVVSSRNTDLPVAGADRMPGTPVECYSYEAPICTCDADAGGYITHLPTCPVYPAVG